MSFQTVWVQDSPQSMPMYGNVPYTGFPQGIPTDPEAIKLAKQIIKANKAEKKKKEEDDKKKEAAKKPPTYTMGQVTFMLMALAIPVAVAQSWAGYFLKIGLLHTFNVPLP